MRINQWFGAKFNELDPRLRALHEHGGELSGRISVELGNGLGKLFGAALAKKLGIPTKAGLRSLKVKIFHDTDGMHWNRCFDEQTVMKSLFIPVGSLPNGYWIECTGSVRMALTVDVIDGGWYWRCLSVSVRGMHIPTWLVPHTTAFKRIEDGQYRFYVGLSLPLIGIVLSYSGLLSAKLNAQPDGQQSVHSTGIRG